MIDFNPFYQDLASSTLAPWRDELATAIQNRLDSVNHGDLPDWLHALNNLPTINVSSAQLDSGTLFIGTADDCKGSDTEKLESCLRNLMPWRKGPYDLFGIHIDTEWRSDFKWDRLKSHIAPLQGRTVLDVGCGNGYHCWRMHAAGAKRVIGIDPSWKFLVQFRAIKHYIGPKPVELLPLGIEDLPRPMRIFDSVFSMGVFYHRRSPFDHLQELWDLLRPGGELILETLVIDGDTHQTLVPGERYAQMRNVWFLPSADALCSWLERIGFRSARCVDINQTSTLEQRATDWMRYHSLADFLDPIDQNLTIEGYPAPTRAIFIAQKPF